MIVQLFIFIIAFLLYRSFNDTTPNESQNEKNRIIYIKIMMFFLILQSGLRNLAVGSDTFQYYNRFEMAILSSWSQLINDVTTFLQGDGGKDPGFALLQKAFATIIPSYRCFLIGVAFLFFYALGKTLIRYSSSNKEVLVCMGLYQCIYYAFFSTTGIRQTIASSFLLLSIPYAFNKKYLKYLIMVLLAATQHKSSLLFLPFVFLPYLKNSRKTLIICLLMVVPISLFGALFANTLITGTFMDQYEDYLNDLDYEKSATGYYIYTIAFAAILLLQSKKVSEINVYNNTFVNAVAISMMLTPLLAVNPSNMRVVQYYSVFGLLILPKCLVIFYKNGYKNIAEYAFLFFAIYTLTKMSSYAFLWQDMQLGPNYGGMIVNDNVLRY